VLAGCRVLVAVISASSPEQLLSSRLCIEYYKYCKVPAWLLQDPVLAKANQRRVPFALESRVAVVTLPKLALSEDASSSVKHSLQSLKRRSEFLALVRDAGLREMEQEVLFLFPGGLTSLPHFSPSLKATGVALGFHELLEIPG